ncbi:MAG: PAS domain-containing protein [Nanoarchaeota archaeon]|nr:PAS domain-containing protein [Nanoarchaeota archaeon]MBU1322354.1 PAS domain-containing protein [Nanoarchaeota archaeon]MBU1596967.1 PAS domain-containing protein [Nanoarchaeota archaeon]
MVKKKSSENSEIVKQHDLPLFLLNQIHEAIIVTDLVGRITYWNKAAEKLYGWKAKEVLGKNVLTLSTSVSHVKLGQQIVKILKSRSFWEGEYLAKGKDGKEFFSYVNVSVFKDSKGKRKGLVAVCRNISEQKKSEDEMRKQKETADRYFNIAGVMLIAIDTKGKVTRINKKGCEILGYKKEEIVGKNWFDNFLPIRLRKQVKEISKQILAGKIKPLEYYENPVLTKSGQERLIAWHNIEMKDAKGKIIGHLSSGGDITKRKKTAEKYRILFDSSRDAIMTLAPPSWRFTSGNRATVEMFRTKDEKQFVSLGPGDVSPEYQPDGQLSSDKAKAMIMKAMKEGSNFFEWTHKRYKGESFPATVLLTRMKLEGKQLLQATVRDITEQKKEHQELLKAYQSRSDLIENAPFGVITLNNKGIVEYINPAMLMISGSDAKKFIGLNLLKLSTYVKIGLSEKIKECLKGKPFFIETVEYISSFGKKRSVRNFTGLPIRDKTGKIEQVTLFVEDITKVKEAEASMKQRTEELERFQKMAVGRELVMVELKKKIKELEEKLISS